jgi:hydroxypyruvate isomerase
MTLPERRAFSPPGQKLRHNGAVARLWANFSANLHFLFTEVPFLERFAAARRAGFTAVEFPDPYGFPLDQIAAQLRAHDLSCVLINLPMGGPGEKGLACLPDRSDEFHRDVDRAITAARALGCPRANCMAGIAPPGADPHVLHAQLVANLRYAAQAFANAGLVLCTEALNATDVPGFFLDRVDKALALIEEVGAANLRFQFDLYHMFIMEPDVRAALKRALPAIEHVQIADHPGRHQPGTGALPYRALLGDLAALGYRGWVGAEYHPRGRSEDSLGWRDLP